MIIGLNVEILMNLGMDHPPNSPVDDFWTVVPLAVCATCGLRHLRLVPLPPADQHHQVLQGARLAHMKSYFDPSQNPIWNTNENMRTTYNNLNNLFQSKHPFPNPIVLVPFLISGKLFQLQWLSMLRAVTGFLPTSTISKFNLVN